MHHVLRAADMRLRPAFRGHAKSYGRIALVDASVGSVHMGLHLNELARGGRVETHLHSFEESFYVLEGEPVLVVDGEATRLVPGACGLVPVGVPHAWIGPSRGKARWIDMAAPQPRAPREGVDTFFLGAPGELPVRELDIRDPRSRHYFRMTDDDIVVDKLALPVGESRFALKGSVLRLVDVTSTVAPGQPVPLAFEFADAAGGKLVVEALVQVRGLVAAPR